MMQHHSAAGGRLLANAREIAAVTGLTPRRVYHEVRTGRLPSFRIGRSICAREGVVRRWIAEREGTDA